MKKSMMIGFSALLAVNWVTPVVAGEFDRQIKARQAIMQLYAYNIGLLGAMAKGSVEYKADAASDAAANLDALANFNSGTMWPKGSDNVANLGVSWAKPDIWTTYPKIAEKGKAMKEATAKLVASAGDGLEGLRANLGAVGGGCKGCHDDFRAPK